MYENTPPAHGEYDSADDPIGPKEAAVLAYKALGTALDTWIRSDHNGVEPRVRLDQALALFQTTIYNRDKQAASEE